MATLSLRGYSRGKPPVFQSWFASRHSSDEARRSETASTRNDKQDQYKSVYQKRNALRLGLLCLGWFDWRGGCLFFDAFIDRLAQFGEHVLN